MFQVSVTEIGFVVHHGYVNLFFRRAQIEGLNFSRVSIKLIQPLPLKVYRIYQSELGQWSK